MWGPGLWTFIHTSALNFPLDPTPRQRRQYRKFFESLTCVLPCGACRRHFGQLIGRGPLRLTNAAFVSRKTLFAYTVRLHHAVNVRLGKACKGAGPAIRDWSRHYESFRAGRPTRFHMAV